MILSQLIGDKIISASTEAFSLHERSKFGEKQENKIVYSYAEAIFLVQQNKMQVYSGEKILDFESLLKKLKRLDKKIEIKSIVFSDLRKKGYIVKSALKFGGEFRVYEKNVKPGEDHARWIVFVLKENTPLPLHEFAAKARVAHSTKKHLLIAIVDEEMDVSYYEVSWIKL